MVVDCYPCEKVGGLPASGRVMEGVIELLTSTITIVWAR